MTRALAARRQRRREERRERAEARPRVPPREYRPPALLLDPTYYRLTFQLAAQRANRLARNGAPAARPAQALHDAVELAENVERTLAWMRWVELNSVWQWSPTLSAKERRLQRFLLGTVGPSAELVAAGLQHYTDDEAADERVGRLLDRGASVVVMRSPVTRWARVEIIPWSARALYSLACYEAAHAQLHADRTFRYGPQRWLVAATGRESREKTGDEVNVAVWALRQAFRVAHDRQRRELVRWAQRDPVLDVMQRHEQTAGDFKALIRRYEIVTPMAPSGDGGAVPSSGPVPIG